MSLHVKTSLPIWLSFDTASNYRHTLIPNAESPDSNSSTTDGNSSQDEGLVMSQAHSPSNFSTSPPMKVESSSLEPGDQKFKTEV